MPSLCHTPQPSEKLSKPTISRLQEPNQKHIQNPIQKQHSPFAKSAIMSTVSTLPRPQNHRSSSTPASPPQSPHNHEDHLTLPQSKPFPLHPKLPTEHAEAIPKQIPSYRQQLALNDTPATTAPSSPQIPPKRQDSGEKVNRVRPTTLDIPGLTKSSVSPDGRIAQRDVGSKLVIVMVGLPARGKSYITKKLTRYLNWCQHDTKIFNVGERRRVAAGGDSPTAHRQSSATPISPDLHKDQKASLDQTMLAAKILINSGNSNEAAALQNRDSAAINGISLPELRLPNSASSSTTESLSPSQPMDQSAAFFDPNNLAAKIIREQCALETLDELLDYILNNDGAVGILDATNSTIERRQAVMKHIRDRAGPQLNVLFVESVCIDDSLLERNMRLKLSGPDYKGKDPEKSLADFKKRVRMYEKSYITLGDYEEKNNMPFIQMIDVGRKVICHQIKGFLSSQAVNYLLNFNLAPRQIWITRHGRSEDNENGRIGGDSSLTEFGRQYARALTKFLTHQRKEWEIHEVDKKRQAHLSPFPGDTTPPNPHYAPDGDEDHIIQKNFCVWTSMLKRSIETSQYFSEEDFDLKQMRMLDEINSGYYEGYTYEEIKEHHRDEFELRKIDKLQYRYPGPGGEGYLDVINRLRPVIVELERMTDHVLLIGHRSVARILLAYFMGLGREEVTDLDVPIGMLYCLEPKPYGVDFKAYRYDGDRDTFDLVPDHKLGPAKSHYD